jgi:hypothetical protein
MLNQREQIALQLGMLLMEGLEMRSRIEALEKQVEAAQKVRPTVPAEPESQAPADQSQA